ncbi:MAG: hypothetical protein IKC03_00925 [Oscillospiraceae bacterium]|nr:hypothetical protein [Oscillospiraceae bacterium]
MQLFVWDSSMSEKYSVEVRSATVEDFKNTATWQTQWTTPAVAAMPNKVALRRVDTDELLGLMSYEINESGLAVEIIYIESAAHSNANLLNQMGVQKKYIGIARALFAYAVQVSVKAGFGGVIFFRAKTTELRSYYMKEFGAVPLGQYDPFRLIVWEDAAVEILASYEEVN